MTEVGPLGGEGFDPQLAFHEQVQPDMQTSIDRPVVTASDRRRMKEMGIFVIVTPEYFPELEELGRREGNL